MWHVRHLSNFPVLFPTAFLITLIYNDTQPSIFKTLHAELQINIVLVCFLFCWEQILCPLASFWLLD